MQNSKILLMGDFNLADIDWDILHYSLSASESPLDNMLTFHLQDIMADSTRTQVAAKSILDLILLSEHFPISAIKLNVIPGISYHDILLCTLPIGETVMNRSEVSLITDFQKADDNTILIHLDYEFSDLYNSRLAYPVT